MNEKPLSGLKVLELASVLAGPSTGMFLAELGAEVIKVENPKTGGDVTRSWKLSSEDPDAAFSAYFASVNFGKEHRFLDLTNEIDLNEVKALASRSDIIIANFRKGQAEKFGLEYKALKQLNSQLIYANITGFGPDDSRPTFDVVLQAETGYMFMNGQPESEPTKMPVALIDVLAAHQLKEAILMALLHREKTGEGSSVEVSLFDAAISALANQASNWLMAGHVPKRTGSSHPNIAPYGEILRTENGKLIVLAIGSNEQFKLLCEVLNLNELVLDNRFKTNQLRVENRKELHRLLQEKAVTFKGDGLMKKFLEKHIPAGLIRDLKEVFEIPAACEMVLAEDKTKRVSQIAFKFGK